MYKNNSRDSSGFKGCSSLQPSCNSTGDDNALPTVNTGLILKRRYGGNDVISPER
jgi:hypothetical protein